MAPVDIAIVGLACRFPGEAKSPKAFYQMLVQGRDAWSKVPKSRYDVDAYRHPSRERRGTMVCEGGYFLEDDVSRWDAPFFACSTVEANAMDPQQRLLLEVAYESLENAGIPMEALAESDAACFVGGFTNDYQRIVTSESEATPQYTMTGNSTAMMANRVSWFLNLRGPSVTVDTACSSSMAAFHLACETIRSESNETRCAMVGGTSLLFNPDDPCGMNALGFLSPDSRCYSFDSRANGYARGEGVAMLVLKHIDDALRDGDAIRGVTAGIVLPNGEAHQRLINHTYRLAGFHPADTQYAELHGTGTRVGDPTEISAVARTLAADRSTPLLCGSVKTQIGHSEAAAAMAGILKCVLSMEAGILPPNKNFIEPNPRLRLEASNIVVPTESQPWPLTAVRRCSINSFGFGGLNGHIILDGAAGYLGSRGLAVPDVDADAEAEARPRLFLLSAPEQSAVARQLRAHADYLTASSPPVSLPLLAHTLGARRSVFQWRLAVVARSADELESLWRQDGPVPIKAVASPGVALVFTGQGAQWHAMGRELLTLPAFARSVRASAAALVALGCPWDAWTELTRPETESRVGQAVYSQPLTSLLQIALVDLLRYWGVTPAAVVGHSSGEMAAAYAVGALSREDCLAIAYHRGLVSEMAAQREPGGAMMAVGLSADEIRPRLVSSDITVACINSPNNVTLAGDAAALEKLAESLKRDDVFCRILKVQNAFHSPQMQTVAEEYRRRIAGVKPVDVTAVFHSTVHGCRIPTSKLTADYWVANLCSPVELVRALDDMLCTKEGKGKRSKAPTIIVEVGPHGVLAGPFEQFRLARRGLEHLGYYSLLSRGRDAMVTAMTAASALWMRGVAVRVDKINDLDGASRPATVLTDMPSYSWNHSVSYWHETWGSRNRRWPSAPKHDLIGWRLPACNPLEPVWKNYLRVGEIPWLKDHQVHGDVVFPAAGVISAVIEAMRQFESGHDITSFELREFYIPRPLLIPSTELGAETFLHLKRRKTGMGSGAGPWLEFSFYSRQDDDTFVEHAHGLVQAHFAKQSNEVDGGRELREETLAHQRRFQHQVKTCDEPLTSQAHYDFCRSIGLVYGDNFQGLCNVRLKDTNVAFEVSVVDTPACMPGAWESDYLVHPTTIDLLFQALLATLPNMRNAEKQGWAPTAVGSIRVSTAIRRGPGTVLQGYGELSAGAAHQMVGFVMAGDGVFDSFPGVVMDGIQVSALGTMQNASVNASEESSVKLYATPAWKPDLLLLEGRRPARLAVGAARDHCAARFSIDSRAIVDEMCGAALQGLDDEAIAALTPHLQQYVGWMQKRTSEARTFASITPPISPGFSAYDVKVDEYFSIDKLKSFIDRFPVDGRLLQHAFACIDPIFSGETTPIAALMASDDFARFYKESNGAEVMIPIFRNWFDLKAHKKPGLRVLEVGGGTGAMTVPILETMGDTEGETPRFSGFTFTDISPGWFEGARTLLRRWKSRVDYKVLNIEVDPVEQGFEPESYDVIVAFNVLHATKSIKTSLENCRRLLKPGGNLIVGECTNPDDMLSFIFGLLPGWWAAEDGRQFGPLLSESAWDKTLKDAGFSGTDIAMPDGDDEAGHHRMSVMVGTKPHEQEAPSSTRDVVILVANNGINDAGKSLAASVRRDLEQLEARVNIKVLGSSEMKFEGKTVISLLEYGAPILQEVQEADFEHIKHVLLHCRELLWVTRSDAADKEGHPSMRIISGLLHCLKNEDASRRLHELHLCRNVTASVAETSDIILRRLNSLWQGEGEEAAELVTVERDGEFCIPRYVPEKTMNRSLARTTDTDLELQTEKLVQAGRPMRLKIGRPGMLDTLHFGDDDEALQPLAEDEVMIEVLACGLNFRDVLIAMGELRSPNLGYEAAGIIIGTGAKVTRLSVGDRVLCLRPAVMRTRIRTNQWHVHLLPACLSIENGVTIPVAYATAYRCLVEVARLEKGETVLIHAAAGGFGQASIHMAKMLGADIFCTVSTEAKKRLVVSLGVKPEHVFSSRDVSFEAGIKRVTNGRGVDVVVNSLAGELLRRSWACMAPYGRFVEVGKRDIVGNSGLDMQPFDNNAVFACVNLDAMTSEPRRLWELVDKVLRLFEQGSLGLIQPIAVHDFSDLEAVFREMQRGAHMGKLALRVTPESRVPVAPRKTVPLKLSPDATYLLAGGLGGLGRAQALFMVEHGARHLAFVSRSGDSRPEARKLLDTLAKAGVKTRAYAGDVADRDGLEAILDDVARRMPPIRGVIQGAMVLDDALFQNMSYDQWQKATRPKIQGSWNLHELLPADLDFFVVLSSMAGAIGFVSQANYAAGNTFQDALAHYRHAQGLPALSIDLGITKGFGYVAEHEEVAAKLKPYGLATVNEQQLFHLLRCAMAGTADGDKKLPTRQLLAGAGTGGLAQASLATVPETNLFWLSALASFSYLGEVDMRASAEMAGEEMTDDARLVDRLSASKTMDEAAEVVQDMLLARISTIMSLPTADIDTAKPVHAYGVDSLVAVELRNWLSKRLRSDVSIFDLTGNMAITTLSRKIASRSRLVPTAAKGQGGNETGAE
ncbi:polyketide synthase [Ophiocordyceps camponoti-floridani]|uniref:Polyketide synthase n=1 Tax=Ophiocordyceps camponoti-floridani TaxID=2030778 RepID=A0A8H4QBQ0_9HYPO|nr:polyketide synthase [Ophiocordyceps camponoti-floridani]